MKYVEIQSGLWLGDEKVAKRLHFIKTNRISYVIDCNQYLNYTSHNYHSPLREPIEENEIKHTLKVFLKLTEYIFDNLSESRNVLVYGHNDMNIAISIIIAFIMRYAGLKKKTVVTLLKSKVETITISRISNLSLDYFEKILFSR